MVKKTGIIVLCLIYICSMLVFSGCEKEDVQQGGEAAPSDTGYKVDKNKKVTLRLYGDNSRIDGTEFLPEGETQLSAFQKEFPNVTIDITYTSITDIPKKVMTDTAAGMPPDVMQYRDIWLKNAISTDMVVPLDDYMKRDPDSVTHMIEGSTRSSIFNGKTYMIPYQSMPYMMFYNKDLFDKVGVAYPTDDWTADEFLKLVRKMTKHDGNDSYLGIDIITGINSYFLGMFDAKLVVRQGDKWIINADKDPGTIKCLETMVDLLVKDKSVFTAEEMQNLGLSPDMSNAWKSGRVAMGLQSNFAVIKEIKVGAVLPPKGQSGGRSTFLQSYGWCIHTAAVDKDIAWELVKSLTSEYYQKHNWAWTKPDRDYFTSGGIPTTKSYYARTDLTPYLQGFMKGFTGVGKYIVPDDEYPVKFIVDAIRWRARQIYEGGMDMSTALKDLAQGLDNSFNPQQVGK